MSSYSEPAKFPREVVANIMKPLRVPRWSNVVMKSEDAVRVDMQSPYMLFWGTAMGTLIKPVSLNDPPGDRVEGF